MKNQNSGKKMNVYKFDIDPCPAPRMTQADRWNKRPAVQRYFAFRNELKYVANIQGLRELPGEIGAIKFSIPMPASWSLKKKNTMDGTPHMVRPDLDNYCKALLDGLCGEDSHIHSIGKLSKVWATEGSIRISFSEGEKVVSDHKQNSLFDNVKV